MPAAAILIRPDAPSLTLRREIKAAPERVFAALTRPEDLICWFGPTDDTVVTEATSELIPGGAWTIAFRTPDGETSRVSGHYVEIEPPRCLAYTWAWASTPERESLVVFELTAKAGGTSLLLTHSNFVDPAARDRHEWGWSRSLDRIVKFAEG